MWIWRMVLITLVTLAGIWLLFVVVYGNFASSKDPLIVAIEKREELTTGWTEKKKSLAASTVPESRPVLTTLIDEVAGLKKQLAEKPTISAAEVDAKLEGEIGKVLVGVNKALNEVVAKIPDASSFVAAPVQNKAGNSMPTVADLGKHCNECGAIGCDAHTAECPLRKRFHPQPGMPKCPECGDTFFHFPTCSHTLFNRSRAGASQ